MKTELGIIEGFYGPPWSWAEREMVMATLAPHGYGFYIYAPKADALLRRRWQEEPPPEWARSVASFANRCREQGVRFGIGLSPFEVFNNFDDRARESLARKLALFDRLGVQELAILFDDMRSGIPDLAPRQVEIAHWIKARTGASRMTICPTYYSTDPVLDRVFGQRPEQYLEALGAELDPAIQVFWTGEEVCSREISPGHLRGVAAALQRKPLLWDNYPVNDGDRMSRHLHVRGFSGRPAANAAHLVGHAINPALQSVLTLIPALTLAESYARGEDYEYGKAFWNAAINVLDKPLAQQVQADLLLLQDAGLHRLSEQRKASLTEKYACFDHPAAREIVRWLAGGYQVTDEMVETQ